MATTIEPAGAASAALNAQTRAVQQPPRTPVNTPVADEPEATRPATPSGNVAPTSQVNPNSRLGNFIDTTA